MFRVIYIVSTFEFSAPATNTKIKNRFTATYLKQSITQRPYILFLPTGLRSSVNAARSGSDTRFEWSAHSMMIHYSAIPESQSWAIPGRKFERLTR